MKQKNPIVETEEGPQHRLFAPRLMTTKDVSLVVVEGPHRGLSVRFAREILQVGRGEWCDLVLSNDRQVSKQHCELRMTSEGVLVLDQGSRNGVFVGKARVLEAYWPPELLLQIGDTLLRLQVREEEQALEVHVTDEGSNLVGRSPKMRRLFSTMSRLREHEFPVVLLGETGTGKTTVARALHARSRRAHGPFVEVNCGALSAALIESLLFGHEKGAFTGAQKAHRGFFEQADGGTLFLDEIGELPMALQPKLLTVLEGGRLQRLGSEKERVVDFRLICSTHRDLLEEVREGRFRQDLYYRLAVVELEIPPLRERLEDLPLLVDWFLRASAGGHGLALAPGALQSLAGHLWPGNVRELYNVLRRSIALFQPEESGRLYLEKQDLHFGQRQKGAEHSHVEGSLELPSLDEVGSLRSLLDDVEKRAIVHALEASDWAVPEAAKLLQITRPWLYKRIKKFGIVLPR